MELSALEQWIGRTREHADTLTPRLIDAYRATLAPNLAGATPGEAPPAIHWCLAPEAAEASRIGADGHPVTGDFLPPIPLPRRMWAGGCVETIAPLQPGDPVMRRSRIGAITRKEGRSGTLCFVTVEHEFTTERGPAIRERQDLVYRDVAPPAAKPASSPAADPASDKPRTGAMDAATSAPAPQCDLMWSVPASPVLLFRYSALTFNSHRIHYDLPYATGTEGYAGLVVHGPLQASLLLNLAATIGGGTPRIFDYRGVAPLIAGGTFLVCGRRQTDGSLRCWTQSAAGEKCMEATASW
ncbi:FAS1-like dehydratase domain-containing protein [Steroidobacter denitrificans]|uniref:FAS1-like dehydratase domain-containing protein n=1 Tax=Steroidobacter denitrificans TaxID=465721 RepID=UPI000A60C688|nr:MaoC family dehydratase N-terminal domain-containing protein [Steroidobacter denitrificans]